MYKEKKPENIGNLICPFCGGTFITLKNRLKCKNCEITYNYNWGFLGFNDEKFDIDSTTDEYVTNQKISNEIVYKKYLKPILFNEPTERILDVGCGIGVFVYLMRNDGYKSYGIDLPNLAEFWRHNNNDPKHFINCSATNMPFPDDYFDFVYSFGVIEHIGTELGHCTLSEDYKKERQKYADEILRVTKKNGRILISCPNKKFPIDILHLPNDSLSPHNKVNTLREIIFKFLGINIHSTWGKYHLLSYHEVEELFVTKGCAKSIEVMPLKDYFSYCSFENSFFKIILKNLIKFYFNNLPQFLRKSFLNPYVLVQIRK